MTLERERIVGTWYLADEDGLRRYRIEICERESGGSFGFVVFHSNHDGTERFLCGESHQKSIADSLSAAERQARAHAMLSRLLF